MERNGPRWALLVVVASCLVACAQLTRSRVHATASQRMAEAQKVAVLAAARVVERTREGTLKRDDWNNAAIHGLLEGARSGFSRWGLTAEALDAPTEAQALFERSMPFLRAVGEQGYGVFASGRILDENEYVVSGVEPVLDRAGADLLLVAFANSEVVRPGKILGFANRTGLWLALIDRTGRVVWANTSAPNWENVDITKGDVLHRWVAEMLEDLPASGPKPTSADARP